MLAVIGFLWAIFAPNCYGESFAYPSVFGAGAIGYLAGRQSAKVDPEIDSTFSLLISGWLHGWIGVMFAVPAVGLGWFVGVIVCFNLLPEFGDYRCIICLEAARQ